MTWRQAHFGAVMLGSLQLSCSGLGQCEVTPGAASSIHQGGTVEVQLNDIKGFGLHHTESHHTPI